MVRNVLEDVVELAGSFVAMVGLWALGMGLT